MIELFRRNIFVNTMLMLPYAFVIRLHTFIWPERYVYHYDGHNYFFQWIYDLISSPISQSIAALLLVYIHAVLINQISVKNRLSRISTLFPGVIYILLVSLSIDVISLSPGLIAISAILIMIFQIFLTYKNHRATTFIFNAGFFGSIAFLMKPTLLVFYIFGFIGLMILRSFKRAEKLQYTAGFVTPIFISLALLYYFKVDIGTIFSSFMSEFGLIEIYAPGDTKAYLYLIVLIILFLVTFVSYNRYTLRKSIQSQKKIDLIYWLSFFSLITTLINTGISYTGVLVLSISIALLFSMNLSWIKNKLYSELFHLILLALIVYNFYI